MMYLYIGNPPSTGYGLEREKKLHQYIPPSLIYIIYPTSTETNSTVYTKSDHI